MYAAFARLNYLPWYAPADVFASAIRSQLLETKVHRQRFKLAIRPRDHPGHGMDRGAALRRKQCDRRLSCRPRSARLASLLQQLINDFFLR